MTVQTKISPAWVCDGCGKAHLHGAWGFRFSVTRTDTRSGEEKRFAKVCDLDCLQLWLAEEASRERAMAG